MAERKFQRIDREIHSFLRKKNDISNNNENTKKEPLIYAVGMGVSLLNKQNNGENELQKMNKESRRKFIKKATSALAIASTALFFSLSTTSCDSPTSDCECEDVGDCSCHQVCTCNKVCTCQAV